MKKKQWICLTALAAFLLFLVLSPRQNIMTTDVLNTYAPASAAHWLGTDNLGRDVYSLLVAGGLRTMEVVFLSAAISFCAGTALGLIAAFWSGPVRSVIQFIADYTLIIPSFIIRSPLLFAGGIFFSSSVNADSSRIHAESQKKR